MYSKGMLEGKPVKVIAMANKKELANPNGLWTEYTLIDDNGKIYFLNFSYGHFTLMTEDPDVPCNELLNHTNSYFRYKNQQYKKFSSYNYNTLSCAGEFQYDVIDVRRINCIDFIAPPYAVSVEKDTKGRLSGFSGRHVTRKEAAEIVGKWNLESIEQTGVGMSQPFYFGIDFRSFSIYSLIFLAAFAIISLLTGLFAPDRKQLVTLESTLSPNKEETQIITRSFILNPKAAYSYFLHFKSVCHLDNNWVDIQLALINEVTGEERYETISSEYYSGIEDGYFWTEGSDIGEINLSDVPPGVYHLELTLYRPTNAPDTSFYFEAETRSPVAWNFSILFFPYVGLLGLLYFIHYRFEQMRSGERDNFFS